MPIRFSEVTNEREAFEFSVDSLHVEELTADQVAAELQDLGIMIKEYEAKKHLDMFDTNTVIGMYLVQNVLYKIYNRVLDGLLVDSPDEDNPTNLFSNKELQEM